VPLASSIALSEGDRVEYVSGDDDGLGLYQGHPGLLDRCNTMPPVNVVGFVNGPSLAFGSTSDLRLLDFDEYLRRGRRLVAGLHPLEDREVPRFNAEGQEWPEGEEPVLV
jgi:hypothetical protein